jgi:hypothetical protein
MSFLIGLAVIISIVSAAQYAWSAWRGLSRPNPVSWFFWGLVPLITFFAQLEKGIGLVSIVSLALAIANLGIMVIAIYKQGLRVHLNPLTISCIIAASTGIVAWGITDEPELAIAFSIIADIFASLPTFVKVYRDRTSEYPMPFMLSGIVMILTLLSVSEWRFAAYGFALYCLLSNVIIASLAIVAYRPQTRRQLAAIPKIDM